MPSISRRTFLKLSALSACSLVVSTGLSGCNSHDNHAEVGFLHGVAAGDPLQDKVIIWTRVTTDADSIDVDYEVSTDSAFNDIIHNGTVRTSVATDFTLKIDIQELDAGTQYYYRFKSNGKISETGRMKTLPVGSVEQVRMAVFSCANYTNGYFNAYDLASQLGDIDVTVHLGDYIYEYGMYEADGVTPAYATSNAAAIGRVLPAENAGECITLEDYRRRYALYRTDKGLQALHKSAAMIVVWDDHEIANDAYKGGAENHNSDEGAFDDRVAVSLQAYFEWLPIRPVTDKKEIYRNFTFGDLLSLHMLETRIFGRDRQLSYSDYYNSALEFDQSKFTADLTSSDRTMMGAVQAEWLQTQMAVSTARWEVLGQQVLMGRMSLPAEMLTLISMLENPQMYGMTKEEILVRINSSMAELVTLKMRKLQGETLTAEEETRLSTVMPYNLDAWDGYFAEREVIFGTAKAYGKNLIVLAGDTHNAWANDLKDMHGEAVGVEFATTSVSSPGLEEYLSLSGLEQAMQLEGAFSLLIDDMKYCNILDRGFMEVVFTHDNVVSNWHFVSHYDSALYSMNRARGKTLQCSFGEKRLKEIDV